MSFFDNELDFNFHISEIKKGDDDNIVIAKTGCVHCIPGSIAVFVDEDVVICQKCNQFQYILNHHRLNMRRRYNTRKIRNNIGYQMNYLFLF